MQISVREHPSGSGPARATVTSLLIAFVSVFGGVVKRRSHRLEDRFGGDRGPSKPTARGSKRHEVMVGLPLPVYGQFLSRGNRSGTSSHVVSSVYKTCFRFYAFAPASQTVTIRDPRPAAIHASFSSTTNFFSRIPQKTNP